MKRFVLALAVAVLCGCNANLGLQIGATGKSATAPTVGPGGSLSSGGVGLQLSERVSLGSILGVIGLGWLVGRNTGERDSRMDGPRIPPALDSNRQVNEQDCSLPVLNASANLQCR